MKNLVIATTYFSGANAEMKSELLMWHIDLNESGVTEKGTGCFLIDLE